MIRISLAILLVTELVVGFWNQVIPANFYNNFPTVEATPPYSEHFARDFGGATLGIAVLLAIALVSPRAVFVIPATLAYSVYSIPHFFFHLTHLDEISTPEAIGLTTVRPHYCVTSYRPPTGGQRTEAARPLAPWRTPWLGDPRSLE